MLNHFSASKAANLIFLRNCRGALLVRHEKALWITAWCCFGNNVCCWPAFIAIIGDCWSVLYNIYRSRLMWGLSGWESMARSMICTRYVAPCGLVLLLMIAFSGWTYSALWHFCYYSLLLQMSIVEQALSAAFFHSNIIILLGNWSWWGIYNLIWLSNHDTASFSMLRWADSDWVVWIAA